MEKYSKIKDIEDILVATIMETGTEEYLLQKFGNHKTKELSALDEGLAERETPFLAVAHPIAAAFESLDTPYILDEDARESGSDSDEIKSFLEEALILLENANIRLNQCRQNRFSELLAIKAGKLTEKHLFPDQCRKLVQSEHEHSSTNSKLIAIPAKPSTGHNSTTRKFFPNAP